MRRLAISLWWLLVPTLAGAQPSETDAVPQAEPRGLDRDGARVDVGVSMTSRYLEFNSRNFSGAPPALQSRAPGLRVAGELYPGVFSDPKSPWSRLGVGGSFDQTLGLTLVQAATPYFASPVDEHQWSLGARYRLPTGGDSTVTFALDYSHRVFTVDRSLGMVDTPDTDYAGFEPGADVRAPITRRITLLAGARLILLTSAGSIATYNEYGHMHAMGASAMTGVDFTLATHVALRVTGEMAQIGMSFDGSGMQTSNRDGDPTTIDVGGATDRYYSGSATVAVYY
jgi:hypothetical protein